MKHNGLYIAFLMMLVSLTSFAQASQIDPMYLEKYRTEIGLDMSVPDFNTKTIDAKVMGTRLAGILEYMMENFDQSVYSRKLCLIIKEQVEPLEKLEFGLKKIQFVRAYKSGDEINIMFTIWPDKNAAKI